MPLMSARSIVTPAGASSFAARKAAVLNEPRRKLPESLSEKGRGANDYGLSGRDRDDSRRVLKPDLEVPCGPQPPGGSIAVPACDMKPI